MPTRLKLVPALLFIFVGCAHNRTPRGTTDGALPLDRVVLYRNGVGYFERHGEVDGDALRIRVRKDQINDVLKSLTVMDAGSGRAVSVSMPLDPDTWASAALARLGPGNGRLAEVLDGLRGAQVILRQPSGRVRGRIVMVEVIEDEPDPEPARTAGPVGPIMPRQRDHRVTLLDDNELRVVRLSKVTGITLLDGDLAMHLHRRLDASAGEGMFQQVEVELRLAGASSHDLLVSYVVSAPIWKPTYRVVLPDSGTDSALLQAWAVVDNVSGEDWSDVKLALTSGQPISFRYDLHTPRDVGRPDMTESGVRRRARVALGETSYEPEPVSGLESEADDKDARGRPSEDVDSEVESVEELRAGAAESGAGGPARRSKKRGRKAASNMPATSAPESGDVAAPKLDANRLADSLHVDTRASSASGLTRYDLSDRVTVPNGTSTMVAIVNEAVDAEETFLFRPGGAGIGFDANPYRVVRFRNSTPFALEPGPISIYSGGSFVGEGLSEVVGAGTSATIPFAVEPGIMVSFKVEHAGDDMELVRIVRGVLEVETFARKTTTWTAKAQTLDQGFQVLIRHPKAGWNYEAVDPPKGTEELPDAYLVPVSIPVGKREGSVTVQEQTPSRTSISIWDARAPKLMESLLASSNVGPDARKKLEPVVKLRLQIGRIDTEIDGLRRQQAELNARADETRRNLKAIKKDAAAARLRARLRTRLDEFTREADKLGRRIVELNSQRLERKIELEDQLQNLDLRTGRKTKTKTKTKKINK